MIISGNDHILISNRPNEIITVAPGAQPRSITVDKCPGARLEDARFAGVDLGRYGSDNAIIKIENSPDVTLSRCGIIDCNPADPAKEYKYLYFKHSPGSKALNCTFADKANIGTVVAVYVDEKTAGAGNYLLERCLFLRNSPQGKAASLNGGECFRAYDSKRSALDANVIIDECWFEECGSDGEPEIVSLKSGNNVVRRCVLKNCKGGLTSRHGRRNQFIENWIEGCRIGIRLIDRAHTVRGNYIIGQRGASGFSGAIVLVKGLPNSPVNGYFAAHDARIENNTLVDCDRGVVVTNGGKNELAIEPTGIVILEGKSPYETGDLQPITLGMVGMTGGEPVDPPVDPPVPTDLAARVAALEALTFVLAADSQRHQRRFAALAAALAEK
jgi:hypothetical protein